jgi:hypothetical protein
MPKEEHTSSCRWCDRRTRFKLRDSRGLWGDGPEDFVLLGCETASLGSCFPKFRMNIVPSFSRFYTYYIYIYVYNISKTDLALDVDELRTPSYGDKTDSYLTEIL